MGFADLAKGYIAGLPDKVKDWPAEWLENYEERAGIMEYDGGLTRKEAEEQAEWLLRRQFKRESLNRIGDIIGDSRDKD